MIKAGNRAAGFEEVISKAAQDAGKIHGHEVGYVWTHGMVPTQAGTMAFGMIIEIAITSPVLNVPEITHTMIMDTAAPTEANITTAVAEAVSRAAETYRKIIGLSNLRGAGNGLG